MTEETHKVVILNWNDVIPYMGDVFKVLHYAEETKIAEALITSDDTTARGIKACGYAKKCGIPIFVVQHGRYATSDYSVLKKKILGDYFLVWGQNDVKEAIRGGWPKDRVIRIGSPFLEYRCEHEPDGKTVVFAPIHHEPTDALNERNSTEGRQIWKILQAMGGITPLVKLLVNEHDVRHYPGKQFITRRSEEGHIQRVYKDLLRKTSCVVSHIEGTFELLAYSMDIPVVRYKDRNCTMYPSHYFTAAMQVNELDRLGNAVKYSIAHPDKNRERRMDVVIQTGGSNGDTPRDSIIKLVKEKIVEFRELKETNDNKRQGLLA